MSLTGWTVILGAAGVAGFFGRRQWIKKQHQAELDRAKKKRLAEQAELDRIACLDLGKSLMSTAPGTREEPRSGSGGAPSSG
jgi:hypothetical protein